MVEVFAGDAKLSRALLGCGYTVASLDIEYWNPWKQGRVNGISCNGNPLDLTSASGFAFLSDNCSNNDVIMSI